MNEPISAGDTSWVLISTALVFLMTPGLAFFYGGLVRRRNTLNTFMMTFVALAVVGVLWMLCGYSLAFAPSSPWIGNFSWAGFRGVGQTAEPQYSATIPHLVFAMFQGMFAIITPALICGAIVERMTFRAYVVFLALWFLAVYAPVCHWVWAVGGWMRDKGALDFAGGTVVHITAGSAALVCARFLGPRQDHRRTPLVPHNVPFVLLGAGLLWFGWFGFNAGSALAANGLATLAFTTTFAGAAGAMLVWLGLETWRNGKPSAVGCATGAVVGLVGITPAAGYVTPGAALAIGAIAAVASFTAIQLRAKTALDDTLDVFACHGIGGISGALLTGIFATKSVNPAGADGLLYGNPGQLGIQAMAVVVTLIYTMAMTGGLLFLIKLAIPLRVELRAELEGLDRHAHGENAYHDETGFGSLGEAVLVGGEK
ncbi:MAG: ammonium transporter [Blastocatellia bacterium]|nr:ammonium transporter [Blastocatellia bacterium]